jgi:hypothetical protein
MARFSELQNKIIDLLDQGTNIVGIEDFEAQRDGNSPEETVIEITTYDGDEYYFRYNVWPDGETELHRFKLEKPSLIQYDERFSMFREKEKAGDESFDVVVEEKLKEEKKVDLDEIYRDAIREYIRSHREELKEYSDDSKAKFFVSSINDSLSDILEEAIDDHWNDYDFSDETEVGIYEIREILENEGILE